MHPQKVIDTVVEFERDLSAFYQRLEEIDRFKDLKKILHFMNKHSDIHAELIRNFRADATVPALNLEPLHALHSKIKSALTEQLMAAEDMADVYEKLAQAEALISQIYSTISKYFQKTADLYSRMSHNFENLAKDELQHHSHIQSELELYKKNRGD